MKGVKRHILAGAAFVAASLFSGAAGAQNLIVANPAEVTDFRAGFVNPAILSFQEAHAALGGKMFHVSFVDGQTSPFRQGYVSLALPGSISRQMGFGLQAQYFNSPLYDQSNISFVLARRVKHIYSFGLRFNMFSRSFNQDQFDLVDLDDPVFRNGVTQWAGTFGAGVSMFPLPFLNLGIGIDHINRANIALGSETVYQPMAFYAGAVLTVGILKASLSASHEDGRWLPQATLGTTIRSKGYATVGFSQNALQAEGQWRISGPLSLNYNYEYTLFDNQGLGAGSHSITLIHDFDRKRNLPKFELPDPFRAEFSPPAIDLETEAGFYVYSIIDKLDITEQRLTRVVAPDISAEQLGQLSARDLGLLDSTRTDLAFSYEGTPVDLGLLPATLDANLSPDYETFVKDVSKEMNDSRIKTRVIAPRETYLRAAGLRKYFHRDSLANPNLQFLEPVYDSPMDSIEATRRVDANSIKPKETLVSLSARSTTFQITPNANLPAPQSWLLLVRDRGDREVRRFTGSGMPPGEVRWDWRGEAGALVGPGVYTYQLRWEDRSGETHMTRKKYLTVQKLLRRIKIEVTHKQQGTGADADGIDIILKK